MCPFTPPVNFQGRGSKSTARTDKGKFVATSARLGAANESAAIAECDKRARENGQVTPEEVPTSCPNDGALAGRER